MSQRCYIKVIHVFLGMLHVRYSQQLNSVSEKSIKHHWQDSNFGQIQLQWHTYDVNETNYAMLQVLLKHYYNVKEIK